MTTIAGIVHEQPMVARYVAVETGQFTLTHADDHRHFRSINCPGVMQITSVLFFRTTHVGSSVFTVRLNGALVIQYDFMEKDPYDQRWHLLIGGVMPQNNELAFAVSTLGFSGDGTVSFSDVVILYTSDQTTIKISPLLQLP
jgi:hypothetical protein